MISCLRQGIGRKDSREIKRIVEDDGGSRQQNDGFILRGQPVGRYFKKPPVSKYQK